MCLTVHLPKLPQVCYLVLFYHELVFVCRCLVYLAMCLFLLLQYSPKIMHPQEVVQSSCAARTHKQRKES